MPIPTRGTIKANFETGKKPTQAQYHEWIDATYDLSQQAIDTAEAAADVVDDIAIKASGLLTIAMAGTFTLTMAAPVVYRQRGCTVTVTQNAVPVSSGIIRVYGTITVDFDVAEPDSHYWVELFANTTETQTAATLAITTKTAAGFTANFDYNPVGWNTLFQRFYHFRVFA